MVIERGFLCDRIYRFRLPTTTNFKVLLSRDDGDFVLSFADFYQKR